MGIADNTRDGFSHEIISVNNVNKISKHRSPVILAKIVVHICVVDSHDSPRYVESKVGFKLFNRSGDELYGTEETTHSPYNLKSTHKSSQVEPCLPPSTKLIS